MCSERGGRMERKPYASTQPQIIPNNTASHQFHTRHAMYIASLSFDCSSFKKHRFSMAIQILQCIHHCFEGKYSAGVNTFNTCAKHSEGCKVGAVDWFVQKVEGSKDITGADPQIHQTAAVFFRHQPTKVTRTTWSLQRSSRPA